MTSLHRVDDTDPQVIYSGVWITGGEPQEFNQTTHGTYMGGSQVRFTFSGPSVAVYGTISNERGGAPIEVASISAYSIDGSRNATFAPPIPSAVQYQQLLYQSLGLENTQHVLIITSLVSDSAFWLDYFEVGTASAPLPSTNTLLTPAGALPTPMRTSLLSTTPPTNHPQSSASFSASSGPRGTLISNGVIAGVVVGGLVLVALMGIVIWLISRRRTLRRSPSDVDSIETFGFTNSDRTRSPPGSQTNPSMHSISSSVAVDRWSSGPPFTGSLGVYGERQGLITMTASPSGNVVYGSGPLSTSENHGPTNESFTQVVY